MTKEEIEFLKRKSEELKSMLSDDFEDINYDEITNELGLDIKTLENDMLNYRPKLELGYTKLNGEATTPKYNYGGDSGFDLHSTEEITITPFGRALVPTGLAFNIKDGYEIQVRSKSGLAINQGLMVLNSPGTVDSGYNGEVKVIVFNTNKDSFTIQKGMKVAQAVLCPVVNGSWVDLTEKEKIEETERGDKGFGSTKLF